LSQQLINSSPDHKFNLLSVHGDENKIKQKQEQRGWTEKSIYVGAPEDDCSREA